MSWQTYVDSNLVGSGKIARAAILGQKGGVWAISPGYTLSTEEQKAAINAFANLEATQASGVRLGGQKFFTLECNRQLESIHCKKAADGCVLVKTKQAILVAEYVSPNQAPEAMPVVLGVADYLKNAGY